MSFSNEEREALLALKGVGPKVIQRFGEIGIDSLQKLSIHNANEIANLVASMLGSTCWKNSPQSLSAINAAISLAKLHNFSGE
jgi:hypothetical protein